MTARASTSVVGVVVLLVFAVGLAAVVGTATLAAAPDRGRHVSTTAALSLSVADDRLTFAHRAGTTLDVRELRLVVVVDGESLTYQPPVPFFSARGFEPGPTGPFNVAADGEWSPGETASFRVASTNDPGLESGSRVVVRVVYEGRVLVRLSATAA